MFCGALASAGVLLDPRICELAATVAGGLMTTVPATQNDERIHQGTPPMSEVRQLLAEIDRGTHWLAALEKPELQDISTRRHWFTDLGKARFYVSLSTGARGSALDVGAGSGVISAGLSGHFERVVALEHVPEWAGFMRRRFAQDGLRNIEVIHGSAVPLPFPAGAFDLVVVNGVLEWIPDATPGASPGAAQLTFLRDVYRVLSPGGAMGIAIENRLSLLNLGGDEPHGNPSYTVLMPRVLANWRTKTVQGHDYRTWTYSAWGYRRLLRAAGFRRVVIRQIQPTYHTPREVLSLHQSLEARKYFSTRRPVGRALVACLARSGLLGYFAHSFYIEATK